MFFSDKRHALFKELTYHHYPRMYRFAVARLGNEHDAEDVVQEAYLKAFNAFGALRNQTNAQSWLMQILINTIRDHVRKLIREPSVVSIDHMTNSEFIDLQAPEQERLNPEHRLCADEIDPSLLAALKELPEIFLSPLLLRELHEASYQEISRILDIPIGTVMSRLARARSYLRNKLADQERSKASKENLDPQAPQIPGMQN